MQRLNQPVELYDLEIDPFEKDNVAGEAALAATLAELQAQADTIRQ